MPGRVKLVLAVLGVVLVGLQAWRWHAARAEIEALAGPNHPKGYLIETVPSGLTLTVEGKEIGVTPCVYSPRERNATEMPSGVTSPAPDEKTVETLRFAGAFEDTVTLPLYVGADWVKYPDDLRFRPRYVFSDAALIGWWLPGLVSLPLLAAAFALHARDRVHQADESTALRDTVENVEPGGRVGDWRLGKRLGEGAMAEVFEGHRLGASASSDTTEGVAVKVLFEAVSSDPEFRQRFEREALIGRRFKHPNLVTLFASGQVGERLYVVMQRVSGGTLRDRLQRGPMALDDALAALDDICAGLSHAHGLGVVHRDLKPENVLFDGAGRCRVVDFGLARTQGQQTITATGAIMGTPAYMAPEQVEGVRGDARLDLYALGCVAYEMLAGRPPFVSSDLTQTLMAHLSDVPTPLRDLAPHVPSHVEQTIMAMLEKHPEDRPSSVDEVARRLRGDA
ncbi:MAG: serine/threonine protein kinase [Proteobacteria bacterium]|nr:serine/threonine protein kinase [Pseudomonadota bacterium]